MKYRNDTRGTSITVEYALTLLVALTLLGGMTFAVSSLDERRQDQIVEDQLEVAGNEIAVQLEHQNRSLRQTREAHRVATAAGYSGTPFTDTYRANHSVDTPERVATGSYTAQITSDGSIEMTSSSGSLSVEVPIRDDIPVRELSGAPGNKVMIVYNNTNEEFVLQSARDN